MGDNNTDSIPDKGDSPLNEVQWVGLRKLGVNNIDHFASLLFDPEARYALLQLPDFNEETLKKIEVSLKNREMASDPSLKEKFDDMGMGCRIPNNEIEGKYPSTLGGKDAKEPLGEPPNKE